MFIWLQFLGSINGSGKYPLYKSYKEEWNSVIFKGSKNNTPHWWKASQIIIHLPLPASSSPILMKTNGYLVIFKSQHYSWWHFTKLLNTHFHYQSHKTHFEKNKSTSCNTSMDRAAQRNSRKPSSTSRHPEPKTNTNWLQMKSNDHINDIQEPLRRPCIVMKVTGWLLT